MEINYGRQDMYTDSRAVESWVEEGALVPHRTTGSRWRARKQINYESGEEREREGKANKKLFFSHFYIPSISLVLTQSSHGESLSN